jgi:rubrerythrin
MLKFFERIRIWLVVRLLWSSPRRVAEAVRGFQATEADGVWHLHRSMRRIDDPKLRAIVFTHSLEEESHAEEFAAVFRHYGDRPAAPPSYEREDLYDRAAAPWKAFAFVHVGEDDATERFRHLHDALRDGPLRRSLGRIVHDESTHVDLTHGMLRAMGATDDEIRREVLRVRLGRGWQAWVRSGKRVVNVVAELLLSAAYVVLGLCLAPTARRRLTRRVVEHDNGRFKSAA